MAFSIEDGSMQVIHTFATNKPSWDSEMVISPDGFYMAYERAQKKDSEDRDIYILDIEKGQTKPLVQHVAHDRLLGWTPDNSGLFFASDRRQELPSGLTSKDTWDAYLLLVTEGVSQGAPELVKRNIPTKIRPKGFTRDGAYYYAVEFRSIETAVAEVDLQTGKLLTKPQTVGQTGSDFMPSWSLDGQYLAYCVQKTDESQTIRIRNMETNQEREIDPDLPPFSSLRWSSDGKFFLASLFGRNLPQVIYRINANTGERVTLVQNESAILGAAQISLDGRTLFYVIHHPKSQKASLMMRDLESSLEEKLFSMENAGSAQYLNFALSPDGKQLAIASLGIKFSPMTLIHRILTMPAKGGEPNELLKDDELKQYPTIAWTPDGQFLLFSNSLPEAINALFLIPASGGKARELCRPQTMMYGVLWSALDVHPDGKRIAFDCFEYRHEVWAMENFLPTTIVSKGK